MKNNNLTNARLAGDAATNKDNESMSKSIFDKISKELSKGDTGAKQRLVIVLDKEKARKFKEKCKSIKRPDGRSSTMHQVIELIIDDFIS